MKDGFEVAIKIQYPGVAKSIDSDIDNLVGLLKIWDLFPKGIFIDNIIKVSKFVKTKKRYKIFKKCVQR